MFIVEQAVLETAKCAEHTANFRPDVGKHIGIVRGHGPRPEVSQYPCDVSFGLAIAREVEAPDPD
jgi:hypothetical protein